MIYVRGQTYPGETHITITPDSTQIDRVRTTRAKKLQSGLNPDSPIHLPLGFNPDSDGFDWISWGRGHRLSAYAYIHTIALAVEYFRVHGFYEWFVISTGSYWSSE